MLLYFSFFVKARSKYFRIVKYIDKVNKVEYPHAWLKNKLILALPLTNCGTLGGLLKMQVSKGDDGNNISYFRELL